jgi:thioredoxin-related protein
VNWAQNRATLVLALQKGCHFCTESAEFYKRLLAEREGRIRIIAVLPQEVSDASAYLSYIGVHVDRVIQSPLNAIDVRGTPTLMLVNKRGIVEKVWIGKLPTDKEVEVIKTVRGE